MLSIIYFALWGLLGGHVAAQTDGRLTAEKIRIDYAKEILVFNGETREYLDCSASETPFVPESLNELIGLDERTIYCRLRSEPDRVIAFTLPARPAAPAVGVNIEYVCLSGKSAGTVWNYTVPPYPVEKVPVSDSILKIVASYPGLVGDREPRLADVEVVIDARYRKMSGSSRMSVGGFRPWFSTGLYAPPAEVITVKRPAGLRGKIVCRIGASNSTLAEKHKPWKRLPVTFVERVLNENQDTTRLYNLNGGNIYIIPEEPFTKAETFQISGAVKSPDFVLGKTDPQEWLDEIQSSTVPFAELAGERLIWSMPVRILKGIDDPVALTQLYDSAVIQDYNGFHGLSDEASDLHRSPDFAIRCVQDIQIHAGAAYASYPCMFGGDTYAKRAVSQTLMRNSGNAWGMFHEVGHVYQVSCWKWSDGPGSIGEVSNNLNIMHAWNRLYHEWHAGTVGQAKNNYQDYIDHFMSRPLAERNFEDNEQFGSSDAGKGRLIPFCQLAQQYGWKLYAYLGKCARELPEKYAQIVNGSAAMGRREFFCKRVCEYAGADMRPFFDAWGIKYGALAAADMATLPPYQGEEFWKKWDAGLIPDLETERTVSVKLPDDNYDMKEGEIKRSGWTILKEFCEHAYGTDAPPENLLDGAGGTYWATPKVTRPGYNVKPVLVIDMGQTETFGYVEWKHWNNGYDRMNCRLFRLEVKNKWGDDWTLVGEYENETGTNDYKHHDIGREVSGRYLRLTLLEGFPEGGQTSGSVMVAELKIGKEKR